MFTLYSLIQKGTLKYQCSKYQKLAVYESNSFNILGNYLQKLKLSFTGGNGIA